MFVTKELNERYNGPYGPCCHGVRNTTDKVLSQYVAYNLGKPCYAVTVVGGTQPDGKLYQTMYSLFMTQLFVYWNASYAKFTYRKEISWHTYIKLVNSISTTTGPRSVVSVFSISVQLPLQGCWNESHLG